MKRIKDWDTFIRENIGNPPIPIPVPTKTDMFARAVKGGNIKEVKGMLDEGIVTLNSRDTDGSTPLHWATDVSNEEMVRFLIGLGADVNAKDSQWEETPLHVAIGKYFQYPEDDRTMEIVKMIVETGTCDRDNLLKGVDLAMMENSKDVMKLLIEYSADALYQFKSIEGLKDFFDGDISWMSDRTEHLLKRKPRSRSAFGSF
jgi:ankyrin repeat protein